MRSPVVPVVGLTLVAGIARADTFCVGPTRALKALADLGALSPGDIVEIDGNATYPAHTFTDPGSAGRQDHHRGVRIAGTGRASPAGPTHHRGRRALKGLQGVGRRWRDRLRRNQHHHRREKRVTRRFLPALYITPKLFLRHSGPAFSLAHRTESPGCRDAWRTSARRRRTK